MNHDEVSEIPPVVHEVLGSPGQSLDQETREFFEPRFGHDFSKVSVRSAPNTIHTTLTVSQPGDVYEREAELVADTAMRTPSMEPSDEREQQHKHTFGQIRVHTDARAAESAQAVNALAYTVGHHIVFNSGRYSPHSAQGLHLLAHELVHTAQQAPVIARKPAASPCLSAAACKKVKYPSMVLAEAERESEARRYKRKILCENRLPGCRADRHGNPAVETEKLLRSYNPSRLAFTNGIFIDRDMERDFKALTIYCNEFMPPIASTGHCITVPIETEEEAKEFNTTTGPRTIGGKSRDEWREKTMEVLVHEAEHTRFRTIQGEEHQLRLVPGGVPTLLGKARPTCSKDYYRQIDIVSAMNELGSRLQEFPMRKAYIESNVALSKAEREAEMEEWRDHRIRDPEQSITASLRTARCLCGCNDANDLIRETIRFATASWTLQEKLELDREMTDKRWSALDLNWPAFAPQPPKGDFPARILPVGEEFA